MNLMERNLKRLNIRDLLSPLADGKILHQGWSPRCDPEASEDVSEWAVLKTTAIQDGWYDGRFNKRLPKSISPRPHLEVRAGDILITCAGPRSRCGVACIVTETRPRLMISGKMYRFRPNDSLVFPEFLLAYLRSPDGQASIDQMKTGGNESGLNLTHERFFQLRVPIVSLPDQRIIIAKLNGITSRSNGALNELRHIPRLAERYKQSVLAAAFRGDLTADWRAKNPATPTADHLHVALLREREKSWRALENKRSYKRPVENYLVPDELPDIPDSWKLTCSRICIRSAVESCPFMLDG